MRIELTTLIMLFLVTGLLLAQPLSGDRSKATEQPCQLISDNPPKFDPFQFVPKRVNFKGLNRFPKVAYSVDEDGSVGNVKILKGTGSPKVDAGLVKSIQAWKYKPQPGCKFEMSGVVTIDIGSE